MSLIVFQLCFLLSWSSEHFKCVNNTLTAAYELKSGIYSHVVFVPGLFSDNKRFVEYVREAHPEVKLEVVDVWCSSLLTRRENF